MAELRVCRLTTEQLRERAAACRKNKDFKPAYNSTQNAERINELFTHAQESMAEVYEELIDRRGSK